jgi:hypothetical protein
MHEQVVRGILTLPAATKAMVTTCRAANRGGAVPPRADCAGARGSMAADATAVLPKVAAAGDSGGDPTQEANGRSGGGATPVPQTPTAPVHREG